MNPEGLVARAVLLDQDERVCRHTRSDQRCGPFAESKCPALDHFRTNGQIACSIVRQFLWKTGPGEHGTRNSPRVVVGKALCDPYAERIGGDREMRNPKRRGEVA